MKPVAYGCCLLLSACSSFSAHAEISYLSDTATAQRCQAMHNTSDTAGVCGQYNGSADLGYENREVPPAVQSVRVVQPASTYPAPQGKILFSSNRDGKFRIYIMKADGTGITRLTSSDKDDLDARFSPDGNTIVFVRDSKSILNGKKIWMMNSDGSNQREVVYGSSVAFSADGTALLYSDVSVYRRDIATGTTTTLVGGNIFSGGNQFPDSSPAGDLTYINTFVYSFPHVRNIRKLNKNTTTPIELTHFTDTNEGYANGARWSPDGSKILFHCHRIQYFFGTPKACNSDASSPTYQLYTMKPDGTGMVRLTTDSKNNVWAVWSPDGAYIAFRSGAPAQAQSIYIMKADGTGIRRLTTDASGHESYPTDWRIDGTGYALTIRKTGTGIGTVTSSPTGISCGSDCTQGYTRDTTVTLTARATSGSMFTRWSGACNGTSSTCTVTMNQARPVIASFTAQTYALTVRRTGTGSGTVTSSPSGISCGSDCNQSYASGTTVKLTARATSGSMFTRWSGACSGTSSTCTVTMNQARPVIASFTAQTYALTVRRTGTGSGTVTSSPSGINCGSDCNQSYASGTTVKLTASVRSGSVFAGWSGACSGRSAICQVRLNKAQAVTATFNRRSAAAHEFQEFLSPQEGSGNADSTINRFPWEIER